MLSVVSRFEPRSLPSSCTINVSIVSVEVATMLIAAEPQVISEISDIELAGIVKKELNIKEMTMDAPRKKLLSGDKVLHVSYYRPKAGINLPGKTEYRMITVN